MTPTFFIRRPVFAWVIALGILFSGLFALTRLPVEQYPSIAPPSLNVSVTYPGADATVLETNVTQVIEEALNGVEGVLYMDSTSRSNGTASIELTFAPGTDIDVAQMELQNRLSRVEQRLPEEVRRQGIQVVQASSDFLLIVALRSKSDEFDSLELGHIATTRVVDELRRVPGVGDVREFYSPYAMRIWLKPNRLASFNLSVAQVLSAVRDQNSQAAGGAIGDLPLAEDIQFHAPLDTQGRFTTAEEFASIILRANPDGSSIRLGDVADVELGAQDYTTRLEINGKPAAGMAVQLGPGANALDVAAAVKKRMEELSSGFPEGVTWSVPFDSTPFISASIEEVLRTLVEAMVLVILVMMIFLQNWRTTVIPTIVIPITLAGTCLGLWLLGFSLNLLSLFGMILAIGVLVDDAIVVVENVKRLIDEEDLPPYEATVKAMGQVTAPVIGTSLALVATFLPLAFFPGSTGGIYRQFSVTLAVSVLISTILALVLTPALCANLLKANNKDGPGWSDRVFRPFNHVMTRSTDRYNRGVAHMLEHPLIYLVLFAGLLALTAFLYLRMPSSFLPVEDQGSVMTVVQAPPGSTIKRTEDAMEDVKAFYAQQEHVDDVTVVYGFSFFGQGQPHAMSFITLVPWEKRPGEENSAPALVRKAMGSFSTIKEAQVIALNRPSIPSLGVSGGFTFKLEDRSGAGAKALQQARNQLIAQANQSPMLEGVRPEGSDDAPRLRVNIDRIRARTLGVPISEVNAALSIAFGSAYANDFNYEGRVLQVLLQAQAPYRMTPQDVLDLKVLDEQGDAVPFGAFATVELTNGPSQLQRYNGYPAVTIAGSSAAGYSSGAAMNAMEQLAAKLPSGFAYEWTGASYQEQQASGQVGLLLGISLVVVIMVLAALYESWAVPIAVVLVIPLGALGAVLFAMLRDLPADVYFNVGLVTIIGLSAKNAILIVEFALDQEAEGQPLKTAIMNAVRMRFRPVLMTSLTFVLGMLPLVMASGAGAAGRIAVGTGVMGGMIMATVLGLFYIPLFYLAVRRWLTKRRPPTQQEKAKDADSGQEAADHA